MHNTYSMNCDVRTCTYSYMSMYVILLQYICTFQASWFMLLHHFECQCLSDWFHEVNDQGCIQDFFLGGGGSHGWLTCTCNSSMYNMYMCRCHAYISK
jgi:hypothetical protein